MRLIDFSEDEQKKMMDLLLEAGEEIQNLYGRDTDLSERLYCKTNEIEQYKTAYDVEKVVKQLEERMCSAEDEATDIECHARNRHFRDAIEVVSSYILQSQNI